MDPLIEGLEAIVGARHCLTEPEAQAAFFTDWHGLYRGQARRPAPGTVAEVQAILRLADSTMRRFRWVQFQNDAHMTGCAGWPVC